jgi:hypothetical protein
MNTDNADPDSDDDEKTDGWEAANDSDPNNASDSDARETVTVPFTFGDPSTSHSEKYRLVVSPQSGDPRRAQIRINRQYGQTEMFPLVLICGARYTVQLDHSGAEPSFMEQYGFSNYDWELSVDISQGGMLLDDPDDIVNTVIDWPNDTFQAAGKYATLTVLKADDAVNVIFTTLGDLNVNHYQTADINYFFNSVLLNGNLFSAPVTPVTSQGAGVDQAFVGWLRNPAAGNGKGIILVEGCANSVAPLVLEVVKNGAVIASVELPLIVKPVEEMIQRVNLRGGGAAVVTPGGALPPDNGKNVVFLHGFNVSDEAARGWQSEMFKRLWQSGANARYHGVTWKGDDDLLDQTIIALFGQPGFHYHENVFNAFVTAPYLRDYVNSLSGQKTVMAHSLGNMVVASAVADHNMSVGKYFMLNAAVASEAFDSSLWSASPDADNRLVHDAWRSYANACWSARWHEYFSDDSADDRRLLTWEDRFSAVLTGTSVYNLYSAGDSANDDDGDEVFELRDGTPTSIAGFTSSTGRYSWQKQETHKGRGTLDPAGTSWAGWEFGNPTYQAEIPDLEHGGTMQITVPYYPDAAAVNATNALNPSAFIDIPVFRQNPLGMFTNNIPAFLRNELLAEGIPALSAAAGKTFLGSLPNAQQRNFNMNTIFRPDNGAWGRNHEDYGARWLHSDAKDMAYFYTHKLFDKLVEEGELE